MNKEDFVFFWKSFHPFSQWYKSDFTYQKVKFNTAEQFMMYQKAKLFGDNEVAQKILETNDPKEQKALGRTVKNFDKEKWDDYKERIVYIGNYHKFKNNHKILNQLLLTQGKTLVEASPYDKIWGIGLNEDHPDAINPDKWRGQNLLGKILGEVRDDILNEK